MAETQMLPINAYETTEAIVLVAPMPAVKAEDVHVRVSSGTVSIAADARTDPQKDWLVKEWSYGPYERSFELPNDFGFGGGEATLGNGQLAVRILRGDGDGAPEGELSVIDK
jgi:HSP20 family molecular chaperone IbpA